MQKTGQIFAVFAIFLALTVSTVKAAEYLSVADDLPLPNGFVEDVESAVIFDKPDGRLVETRASGASNSQTVAAFYLGSLPALGWQHQPGHRSANPAETKLTFIREREVLTLTITDLGATREIIVSLEPLR